MLLSAIFSLRAFRLKWPKHLRVFSIFLLSTLLVEIFSIAWKWELHKSGGWGPTNLWIYNAFLPIRYRQPGTQVFAGFVPKPKAAANLKKEAYKTASTKAVVNMRPTGWSPEG